MATLEMAEMSTSQAVAPLRLHNKVEVFLSAVAMDLALTLMTAATVVMSLYLVVLRMA